MAELNVKVGDKVIYEPSMHYGNRRIKVVEKITPTGQIKIVGVSNKFDKNGREIGGDTWHRVWISEATEKDVEEIQHEEFVRECLYKIKKVNKLTYEQAIKILEILESEENHE